MMSLFHSLKIIDYFKYSVLFIMFILGIVFNVFFYYIFILILIEFVFKLSFKFINSISYTISNKFYKNILMILNIFNFEFEFLFLYLFLDSIFKFNIKYFIFMIFFLICLNVILFSVFIYFNLNKETLKFRMANEADRESIYKIYLAGSKSLKDDGVDQWQGKYVPSFEDIDLHLGVDLYVLEYKKNIVSTACLVEGVDKDYENIKGTWNTKIPYISIHKVATSNSYKKQNFAKKMMRYIDNFAKRKNMDLRIDTHRDNKKMRNFILSCGYKYTGEVVLHGELERLGYDKKIVY